MYCRYCGSAVADNQKFCRQCGRQQSPETADDLLLANSGVKTAVQIAEVFVWICFLLLLIMGLKMIGDDNYLGVIATLLSAGGVIALFYQWQKWQTKRGMRSDNTVERTIENREINYLSAPNESASVVEDETKRFDTDKIAAQK